MNIAIILRRLLGKNRLAAPRAEAKAPDPLQLVHCDGRPYVIGASTFLVAVQLHELRKRLRPSRKALNLQDAGADKN